MLARSLAAAFLLLAVAAGSTADEGATGESSGSSHDQAPHIRATAAALAVARSASSLVETAATRTRAEMSSEAMAESRASIDADAAQARQGLDRIAGAGREEAAARVRELLDELLLRARRIEDGRAQVAQILRDSQSSRRQLIAATNWRLLPAALASEDDLFYRMVSGRGDAKEQASRTAHAMSVEDLLLYARLASLVQQVDQGYIALEVATRLPDSEHIGTVEENLNLAMYQLRESIESLSEGDHDDLAPTLLPLSQDLVDAAYGEANLIGLMKTRLRLTEQEAQLAAAAVSVSDSLRSEVEAVLEQAIADIELEDAGGDTAMALRAALAVQMHASAIASYSADPTTANTPLAGIPEIRDAVAAHRVGLRRRLDTLVDLGYGAAVAQMYPEIDRLDSITERIIDGRPELAAAMQSAAQQRAKLRSFVHYQLKPAVIASLDNQLYYMLTGRSEFRDGGPGDSDPLSHLEFVRYWHLASVNNSLFRTFSGLIIAIIMTESTLIGEGEERFITASHRLEKSIDFLEREGGPDLAPQLVSLARQFMSFGNGESDVFDSLRHRLPLIATENEMRETARQIGSGLQASVDALLDSILEDGISP